MSPCPFPTTITITSRAPKLCYHPGWQLMRVGYGMWFHMLYDEKKNLATKRKRGASNSVEIIKASEKEFLFGARKLLFLGMHQFHFLSEAPVTFAFIYFFMFLFFLCII